MNKTKILLVNKNLIAGGIETSLISFIEAMKDYADIDVMLFNNSGILKDRMPQDIQVYEGGKILRSLNRVCQGSGSQNAGKNKFNLKKSIIKVFKFLGGRKILSAFALVGQKIKKKYDIVFCYNGLDELSVKFALKCVNAKKKFNYIHSDVSQYDINKRQLKRFGKFDKLLCVSKSCAEIFKKKYPELSSKVDYLYNFQDVTKIKNRAEEFNIEYPNEFNIVSVSRLSKEKAYLRSLKVFLKLHNAGHNFHWHIVGDGDERLAIEEYIKLNQMDKYVTLYGNQKNPYPYIKSADILYLGSYHEAAPMVYSESMILDVPVITTRTSSSDELVGENGFVCNNSEDGIYSAFEEILSNTNVVKAKMDNGVINNSQISSKFINLIKDVNE